MLSVEALMLRSADGLTLLLKDVSEHLGGKAMQSKADIVSQLAHDVRSTDERFAPPSFPTNDSRLALNALHWQSGWESRGRNATVSFETALLVLDTGAAILCLALVWQADCACI